MLMYVRQLVANVVCLLFGAGQVAYSGLIQANTHESTESAPKQ